MTAAVATLTWTEPADLEDPHDALRRARARHWWASNAFGITVLSHDGVRALLADPRLQGTGMMFLERFGITAGPIFEFGSNMLFTNEGARHRRLRQLVSKAFTPRAVEVFRPRMRAIAEQFCDHLAEHTGDGDVEFVSAFADPYPAWVLCEFTGLSHEDAGRFSSLATDLGLFFSVRIADEQERITRAILELYALMDDVIADRRAHPRDDFVTGLVQAEADGDRLSRDELRVMLVNLVLAGETARAQAGCTIGALARHPGQWAALAAGADVPRAVEETLRWEPAVDYVPRLAVQTVQFGDAEFEPGTWIELSLMSANRDEAAYPDPDRFDIARAAPPVSTFGGGAHYCLGAALSRAELQEAVTVLAARYPRLELAGAPVWRNVVGGNRCYGELPLRFGR
jgi:hypothetical protein